MDGVCWLVDSRCIRWPVQMPDQNCLKHEFPRPSFGSRLLAGERNVTVCSHWCLIRWYNVLDAQAKKKKKNPDFCDANKGSLNIQAIELHWCIFWLVGLSNISWHSQGNLQRSNIFFESRSHGVRSRVYHLSTDLANMSAWKRTCLIPIFVYHK